MIPSLSVSEELNLLVSGVQGWPHLYQLFFGVFQPAEFALSALSQVTQPVSLHFGLGDLILHLLLQVLLLHRHCPVLLLSLFQSGKTDDCKL